MRFVWSHARGQWTFSNRVPLTPTRGYRVGSYRHRRCYLLRRHTGSTIFVLFCCCFQCSVTCTFVHHWNFVLETRCNVTFSSGPSWYSSCFVRSELLVCSMCGYLLQLWSSCGNIGHHPALEVGCRSIINDLVSVICKFFTVNIILCPIFFRHDHTSLFLLFLL